MSEVDPDDPALQHARYHLSGEWDQAVQDAYTRAQIEPTPNQHPAIQDLLILDIEQRKQMCIAKYGTVLQGHNGRDALIDAFQEAMDLAIYLRQMLYERDGR